MSNKKYYWLKLKKDFFTSKAMKKLRKIAGGDTYTVIYLKLQLLSLENNGELFFEEMEDDFESELALEIDEKPENVKVTILFLKQFRLLEVVDALTYKLPAVLESTGKETESAKRVRKHRDSTPKALHCNKNVTTEIEIEKEIELETEKIKKINKKKKPAFSCIKFLKCELKEFWCEKLEDSIKEHLKIREKKKAGKSERAMKQYANHIKEHSAGVIDVMVNIVDQSEYCGYVDIFPMKQNNNNFNTVGKPKRQKHEFEKEFNTSDYISQPLKVVDDDLPF